jgi:nucleoside phosphorylase
MKRKRFGIAKIVLVGVIDEELQALRDVGNLNQTCFGRYFVNTLAPSHDYDIVACRADGWGNMASGEAVNSAIEDFRPQFVFLVGIAGGIVRKGDREPIQLGNVIVADYLHYSELKKLSGGKTSFRFKPHDHPSYLLRVNFADPLRTQTSRWSSKIKTKPPATCDPIARIENLVTGETLLGDPGNIYQQIVLENYYTAQAVDMESMGVGREIFYQRQDPYYNPQFLIVRGISDLVEVDIQENKLSKLFSKLVPDKKNNTNQQMRDAWRVYAAEAAAAFALTLAEDVLEYVKVTSIT